MLLSGCTPSGGTLGLIQRATKERAETVNLRNFDSEITIAMGSGNGPPLCFVGVVEAFKYKSIRLRDGKRTYMLDLVLCDTYSRADPTSAAIQTNLGHFRLGHEIFGSAARDR